jgi:hypothetical protein
MPLRLIAARGGVGIELYAPQRFGPLVLLELEWSLPGLAFPLDLSGGVREFRHRRGQLQHAVIELDPARLAEWLRGRLSGALGGLQAAVSVWPVHAGVGIGLRGADGCLAFDWLWAPTGDTARFVISAPRIAGRLRGPAIQHALTVTDTALGRVAKRAGRVVELGPLVELLTKELLPPLGVRVPSTTGIWLSDVRHHDEVSRIVAAPSQKSHDMPSEGLRGLEFAELVREADEALVAGDLDGARARYMTALEHAPRHPELCHVVASIDKDYEERTEAALGLLVESLPATAFGLVGAELLAQVGDEQGAETAIRQQAHHERYPSLAALLWLRLSELSSDPVRRADALDQALATCPSSEEARWGRFLSRLDSGDLNGAVADAEHLEAAARGNEAKHAAITRAAAAMQTHGYQQPARRLFERALRYLPSDVAATLGLARAFIADGSARRALVLLRRAAELVNEGHPLHAEVQLQFAKHLAVAGRDLPQAIARVRQVAGRGPALVEARALEARWRARLGDLAGATITYGKLRDAIELSAMPNPEFTPWLMEAASFARSQGDLRSAERQLALALELSPNRPDVLAGYRDVAAQLAPVPASRAEPRLEPAFAEEPASEPLAPATPEQLEIKAEALMARLLGAGALTPEDTEQLSYALTTLGRHAELHAVLWARFEDADEQHKDELRPQLSRLLRQMAERARAAGEPADAQLYELQLEQVSDNNSEPASR